MGVSAPARPHWYLAGSAPDKGGDLYSPFSLCWHECGLLLLVSRSVVSNSLQSHGLEPASLLCPWDFPSNNTEVGCHFLLQGIFPTQGLNLRLLHQQMDSLPLSHLGSPHGWMGIFKNASMSAMTWCLKGWSPPGSSVHGIFQARILGWVPIAFSRVSFRPRDWTWVSCLAGRMFTTELPGEPLGVNRTTDCVCVCVSAHVWYLAAGEYLLFKSFLSC